MQNRCTCWHFFGFFFVLGLILAAPVQAGGGTMLLEVEIQSGVAVDIPESFALPAAAPGSTVEGSVDLVIWANTDYDVTVSGEAWSASGGETVTLLSAVEVQDFMGVWRALGSEQYVASSESPTGSEGAVLPVAFRLNGDFGDAPGDYEASLVFTVVPQL